MLVVSFIMKFGFSDSLLSEKMAVFSRNKWIEMKMFPTYRNELPLLFSIYSNLAQTRVNELQLNDNKSSLFEKYYSINSEAYITSIKQDSKLDKKFIEGDYGDGQTKRGWSWMRRHKEDDEEKKKLAKNYHFLILVYYYSILLVNEMKLPYPKFIFVHDWIRQYYGGFSITIDPKKAINGEIIYKSKVIDNDVELLCSFEIINIFEGKEKIKLQVLLIRFLVLVILKMKQNITYQ